MAGRRKSRWYASAVLVLGLAHLLAIWQLVVYGRELTRTTGAGGFLPLMHGVSLLTDPVSRLVMGWLIIVIAMRYFKGRLSVPETRTARWGQALAVFGLVATGALVVWQLWTSQLGAQASILIVLGAAQIWLSFLTAGFALVEGSRILEISRRRQIDPEYGDWQDTEEWIRGVGEARSVR